MVATSGQGWRLAPSLVAFVKEADRLYPNRDRSSDGSIGDLAHSARESDHNPYDGWVHAVDLDDDIAPGVDLSGFAAHLLASRDPRVRYVIYEGRIFKSYIDSAGRAAWTWMPYTGTNAHTQHLHLSINRTDQARNDLRPWFPQEDDMTPEQVAVLSAIHGEVKNIRATGINTETALVNAQTQLANVEIRLEGLSRAVAALAAGDGASAQEIVDELAKRLEG